MRLAFLSVCVFFALCSSASAKFLTLNEIGEASCRVNADDSRGSGTSIAQDKQFVYVLTNAHVVGNSRRVTCEFFRYGRKTSQLAGEVIWRAYSEKRVLDFAIIRIPKSLFGSMPPRIVPLAPPAHLVKKDDYIASAGCPQGRWLQLWEGHALSAGSQSRVLFTPPPLGGQSGSGVYTLINGNTHLAAVLTWRVDDDKGGAIHISNFWRAIRGEVNENQFDKVPSTWKFAGQAEAPKAKKIEGKTVRKRAYYARGSNGYYYLQTFKEGIQWKSVIIPNEHKNVRIIEWNILLDIECPFGICPPFIPPQNPNPNPPTPDNPNPDFPFPNPDDNPDGSPGGDGEGENPFGKVPPNYVPDDAQTKIDDLEKRIKELEKERVELQETITQLNSDIKSKLDEIDSLTHNAAGNQDRIEQLQGEISKHLSDLEALNNSLSSKEKELKGSLSTIDELQKTAQAGIDEVKTQRNQLGWFSGGIGAVLLWVFSLYWKIRGKKKVEETFNPDDRKIVEDKKSNPEPRETPPVAVPVAPPDMGALADFLQDKVGSILDEKLGAAIGEVTHKVETLEQKLDSEINLNLLRQQSPKEAAPPPPQQVHVVLDDDSRRVLKDPPPVPEQPHDTHEDCDCECGESILDEVKSNPEFPDATGRIKQFIDLKAVDGECVTELAFYAHLYKDAISLLREDRLIVKRKGKNLKVNYQLKAADAIDTYVRDQFLKRVSTATVESHALYHEAMIGFLYKEAVKKLRRGDFNVLGYKDMAYSIEEWVKTEFLKRMGFQF